LSVVLVAKPTKKDDPLIHNSIRVDVIKSGPAFCHILALTIVGIVVQISKIHTPLRMGVCQLLREVVSQLLNLLCAVADVCVKGVLFVVTCSTNLHFPGSNV